jgi:predicted cupin superfamily sugar epimerase
MDERKQHIIKAVGEQNILDASLRMTDASRRITDIVPKLPMAESLLKISENWRRISEMCRPPLLVQQHNVFKSITEAAKPFAVLQSSKFESILGSNKLFSDYLGQ